MLTKTQKLASEAKGKNILVSAGAGTGKTRVLVERFLNLVVSGEALVTEILALTYTDKAANEMKKRIRERLLEMGQDSARRDLEAAYISTIHAFCARILREHPLEAEVDPDFRVMESEESDFLKEQALDEALERHCEKGNEIFELVKTYGEFSVREGLLKVLSAARHRGMSLEEFFTLTRHCETTPKHVEAISDLPAGQSGIASSSVSGELPAMTEGQRLAAIPDWTWETVEEFKDWIKTFSRKGNKETKPLYQQAKVQAEIFLAQRIEEWMTPWKEKFEKLALFFEAAYETKKREKSFLDFDDLQILTVRLFKREGKTSQRLQEDYRRKFRQIMVDEFQDTNLLQLELIELLKGEGNLFFVGDFKQSIYGFRGADPSIFRQKEMEYENSGTGVLIPLVENFRSEPPVLDFVNQFFVKVPGLAFGPDLASSKEETPESAVEVLLIRQEEEETLEEARIREAEQIAEKILELKESGTAFGKIAILFQAMTHSGLYEQALKKRGIPYTMIAGGGFYHQPEIRDMMSFLAFLENPRADIPLAASLRSPLFQIHDNTLFWLARSAKEKDPTAPLYDSVRCFEAMESISAEEKEKLKLFDRITREFLSVKDHLKLTELLDLILEKTSYELTVLADPHGVRRYANLKKLVNLARELERYEPLKLTAFLRTLRRLETREIKESEAAVEAEESGQVVKISTIHRAKGLEFDTVFLADMGYSKRADQTGWIKIDSKLGYGIKVWNEAARDWEKPFSWQQIDETLKEKARGEWERLFYVAATRAEKRLILSGVYAEKKTEGKTWMDWVMAHPVESLTITDSKKIKRKRMRRALAEKKDLREVFGNFRPKNPEAFIKTKKMIGLIQSEAAQILAQTEDFVISPARVIDLPVSAYSAFDQSPKAYGDIYEIGYSDPAGTEEMDEASFPETETESAADFGTAVHRVLELLDFRNPEPVLVSKIKEVLSSFSEKRIEEAREILGNFIRSKRFRWIQNAKKIYREIPFILNERHGRLQGVVDLLIQDSQGDWHVLDYKTAVGDPKKIKDAGYPMQIKIYTLAVLRILGMSPKSGIVYFLKNGFEHTESFDAKSLPAFEAELRRTQEAILEYSHQFVR